MTSATVANAQVTLQPGDILVADQSAAAVFLIRETPTGTTVTTVADSSISVGGLPIFTPGFGPNGIALNADGSIIVDDAKNSRVLRIEPGTGNVTLVAQGDANPPPAFGGSGSGVLFRPLDFAIEANGDVLVLQDVPPAIFRIRADTGDVTTVASGDPFGSLGGIALEADGNILVTDLRAEAVLRVSAAGTSVTTVGVFGAGDGIEVAPDGQIVMTEGGSSVQRIDPATGLATFVGGVGAFLTNTDVTLEEGGDILVSSFPGGGGRTGGVFRIDPTVSPFPGDFTGRSANVTTVWDAPPLAGPHGIVIVGAFVATTPPVAAAQSLMTAEDTPIAITLSGSDPQGDPLTFAIAAGPAHGALSGTPPDLSYRPGADFNGADSFTFTVSDGSATSEPATVAIAVSAVNDSPAAIDDTATTIRQTPVTLAVLANDRDVDGDVLAVTGATQGSNGTTVVDADGTVTYTPNPPFTGIDTFTYAISDGRGGSATAQVSVTVSDPIADLQLAVVAAPDPVITGNVLTYTITVRNAGPDTATGVVLRETLDQTTTFLSASSGCRYTPFIFLGRVIHSIVTCDLGTLSASGSASVRILVRVSLGRTRLLFAEASVFAKEKDPNRADNRQITRTAAQIKRADLALTITDSPDPVREGQAVTYTYTVTNLGPATAIAFLDGNFYGGLKPVSMSTSQGLCRPTGEVSGFGPTAFTCALGIMASQSTASVSVRTVLTRREASVSSSARVEDKSGQSEDPVKSNNVATERTRVISP